MAIPTRTLAVRLPLEEADALEALAVARGRRVSDELRGLVSRSLRAHARRTDPSTSHEAARSVHGLTERREAVLRILRERGPMTDSRMVAAYLEERDQDPLAREWPQQSVSGLRTRRAELVDDGLVVPVGESRTPAGRRAIVWGVAS